MIAMLPDESGTAVLEREDMAKKKAGPPRPEFKQKTVLSYKADERTYDDVRKWIEDLANDIGAPVPVTVDIALKALGKERGLRPMPKRLAR